ncbi:MAG: 50S ribosomal protein L10 [archaeon]
MSKTARVSDEKKKTVAELTSLFKEYPIAGTVNMENLPTPQLQNMREQLRSSVVIKVAKRRLIRIALEKAKDDRHGIEMLREHLKGMPGLIFTHENPFRLAKILDKNKSSAPAKAGQTAPSDLKVNAGPTPFAPGPLIGELGAVGIKTGVENGKITIKQDAVVTREGEVISAKVAGLLTRLGIKPMEVGLRINAVYEDGEILTKDVLYINEQEYLDKISLAASQSFNLAVYVAYPAEQTMSYLLTRCQSESRALAIEQNIMADAVAEDIIGKANSQMLCLKALVDQKMPQAKAEPQEEKPAESAEPDGGENAKAPEPAGEKSGENDTHDSSKSDKSQEAENTGG